MNAHEILTSGFGLSNAKVAMTLRTLAGGLHSDLALLCEVGPTCACKTFHNVVKNWMLDKCSVRMSIASSLGEQSMILLHSRTASCAHG